jgi:polysaccharide export outer membrane protein
MLWRKQWFDGVPSPETNESATSLVPIGTLALVICALIWTADPAVPAELPAAEPPSVSAASDPAGTAGTLIGVGDVLDVRVYGDDSSGILSGRYSVGQDGTIAYPVLGDVPAAGARPADLAQTLSTSLTHGLSIVGVVSVSIVEYAPVYLIGETVRTGSFPFRPGMTVVHLVLEAGGFVASSEDDLLTAVQELSELDLQQLALAAQRARLLAELRGEPFDAARAPKPSNSAYADVIGNEVALFEASGRARQAKLRALEAQRARTDDEIKSLRESITLHDEEVRILEEELNIVSGLVERGVSPQSKLNDLRRELGRIRRDALEFRTELFRAEQALLLTEQEILNVDIARDEDNLIKLTQVELDLRETSLKLDRTRTIVASLREATSASQKALGRKMHYTLFRLVDGEYQDGVAVDEFAKLQRGDIIRVTVAGVPVKDSTDLAQVRPVAQAGADE